MMDVEGVVRVSENGAEFENGVHEEHHTIEEQIAKATLDGAPRCRPDSEDESEETFGAGLKIRVSEDPAEGLPSQEPDSKELEEVKNERQKVVGKSKIGKPSNGKSASVTVLRKSKDGPASSRASNGTVASESLHRQPAQKSKSKSSNERQPVSSSTNSHGKQSGHSDVNTDAESDSLKEKPKLSIAKKSQPSKAEAVTPPLSPNAEAARARKPGALPNYGFSFKCNERAEKRREFYSKLEEKIHAKEVEKSTLIEKSKESQEAELRMLRKSLRFKATPMPSFYQEPAPPKAELKKIPTTRAKSPKLGRKKSSPTRGSEESDEGRHTGRLSLDEKLSHSIPVKTPTSAPSVKKPLRKSLPRLPSQKTALPEETRKASSKKPVISNPTNESSQPAPEPSPQAENDVDVEGDIMIESQTAEPESVEH